MLFAARGDDGSVAGCPACADCAGAMHREGFAVAVSTAPGSAPHRHLRRYARGRRRNAEAAYGKPSAVSPARRRSDRSGSEHSTISRQAILYAPHRTLEDRAPDTESQPMTTLFRDRFSPLGQNRKPKPRRERGRVVFHQQRVARPRLVLAFLLQDQRFARVGLVLAFLLQDQRLARVGLVLAFLLRISGSPE